MGMIAAIAVGCGGNGTSNLPKGIMAQVGQVSITEAQLNQQVADFEIEYAGQVPDPSSDPTGYQDFRRSVLDYLITYELVKQQAATLKISVSNQEVQDQIDQIKSYNFNGDQAAFDAALKQENLTLAQFTTSFAQDLLMQKAYDQVTSSVTDSSVSKAEIQAYYDANKSQFYTAESRDVRHILIAPVKPQASSGSTSSSDTTTTAAPTQAQWAAALATAQKVRADLVAGADWKTEAAKYSDDIGTKDIGGELGPITKGEMVAEFEDAAFSLAKGAISQPVKTVYGYHIIQVESITPAKQSTVAEATPQIITTLVSSKKDTVWQNWVAETRAAGNVIVATGMETTTTTAASTGDTGGTGGSSDTSGATTTAGATATTTAGATATSTGASTGASTTTTTTTGASPSSTETTTSTPGASSTAAS